MKSTRYLVIRLNDLTKPGDLQMWHCLHRLKDFKRLKKKTSDNLDTEYVVHHGSRLPYRFSVNTFPIYKFNGTTLKRTKNYATILGEE